jgi:hypothetical protein
MATYIHNKLPFGQARFLSTICIFEIGINFLNFHHKFLAVYLAKWDMHFSKISSDIVPKVPMHASKAFKCKKIYIYLLPKLDDNF